MQSSDMAGMRNMYRSSAVSHPETGMFFASCKKCLAEWRNKKKKKEGRSLSSCNHKGKSGGYGVGRGRCAHHLGQDYKEIRNR